ncbi:acylglycerol lipase [Aspergillus saccharolyticus JOP 1030-1]|uniref:Putative alpha/beta hydrolase n=1 Tax=Aspergillus saccharolyticus JOP 1030-1 TaxID=1450539 RepID=A0A319A4A1_9EURO|nr:putative alpha/beta hydrolase [Aspergillus saccharolyticus JOP 1030-1]PYH42262.1 putative alpha/beta hydrolase [Aspergillus saccharolyticus JOP 1030-1]
MTDLTITEGTFVLPDGVEVYQKTWSPPTTNPPLAIIVHFHGFSDHINNYYDLFPTLARQRILCTGIDQRGWGRSVRCKADRGNTGPTPLILADMAAFIHAQQQSFPDLPLFLSGHSMGGGLVATLASTPKYQSLVASLRGLILEAPYIGLTPEQTPSSLLVFAGRLAGRLLPHFQLTQKMVIENLVRDPEVQRQIKNDPLNHMTGTLEMFANMLDRAAALTAGKLVLSPGVQSVLVAHGTGDQCTSYEISKRWFDQQTRRVPAQQKKFASYDGWSHIMHADLPELRAVYANDVAAWVVERSQEKSVRL